MNDEPYKDPIESVSTAQTRQSAATLQKLAKLQSHEATIDDVICSLEQTKTESHAMSPNGLCDLISVQARILDAAFNNYIDKAQDNPAHLEDALRLQQQTLRTLMAWKALKSEIYIQRKIVDFSRWDKKRIKRTEQNAALDE
jgi:hypothetical protein